MKKGRFRATPLTKVIIGLLVVGIAVFGVFKAGLFDGLGDKPSDNSSSSTASSTSSNSNSTVLNANSTTKTETIRIFIDEWVGYDPLIQANGGFKTTKDSFYGQNGLDIEIVVSNDATQTSNALIKGDVVGAGYTINRFAALNEKFVSSGVDVVMPIITNYSYGADGIIAKSDIYSINDLAGRTVGVPRLSEAHTLVQYLIDKSDMTDAEKASINYVYFDTPDQAAQAFFAGKVDASATWQPFLTQAVETTGARVLFSTKSSTNLIFGGITFRKDFVDSHQNEMAIIVDGILQKQDNYKKDLSYIKELPLFAMEDDAIIVEIMDTVPLVNYNDNIELMNGIAQDVYRDMSNVWSNISKDMIANGELTEPIKVYPDKEVFDMRALKTLESKYSSIKTEDIVKITSDDTEVARQQDNTQSLLSRNVQIQFQPNSAVFLDSAKATEELAEFISIAKTLNGAIIQIEGNVADLGWNGDTQAAQLLSEQRANAIAKYLAQNGIDANRFIVVGNGTSNPIADNSTEAGATQNRRTDIYFKIVE